MAKRKPKVLLACLLVSAVCFQGAAFPAGTAAAAPAAKTYAD
jgi:hypothetical protein